MRGSRPPPAELLEPYLSRPPGEALAPGVLGRCQPPLPTPVTSQQHPPTPRPSALTASWPCSGWAHIHTGSIQPLLVKSAPAPAHGGHPVTLGQAALLSVAGEAQPGAGSTGSGRDPLWPPCRAVTPWCRCSAASCRAAGPGFTSRLTRSCRCGRVLRTSTGECLRPPGPRSRADLGEGGRTATQAGVCPMAGSGRQGHEQMGPGGHTVHVMPSHDPHRPAFTDLCAGPEVPGNQCPCRVCSLGSPNSARGGFSEEPWLRLSCGR